MQCRCSNTLDNHAASLHSNLQGVPTLPELKLSYYQLMIRYYAHYNNYLEMTRCYKSVLEIESVSSDASKWTEVSTGVGILGFVPAGQYACWLKKCG